MIEIEKRALELLVAEYRRCDQTQFAQMLEMGHPGALEADKAAIAALISALTPPEGYVLVPVEPTEEMLVEAGKVVFREAGQQWADAAGYPEQWVIDVQRQCHTAMLAARPEVP